MVFFIWHKGQIGTMRLEGWKGRDAEGEAGWLVVRVVRKVCPDVFHRIGAGSRGKLTRARMASASGYVNFRNKLPSFPKDSPRESFPFLLAHSLSQFLHYLPADLPSLITYYYSPVIANSKLKKLALASNAQKRHAGCCFRSGFGILYSWLSPHLKIEECGSSLK